MKHSLYRFLWVDLQIEQLFKAKMARDLLQKLEKGPADINKLYALVYEEISSPNDSCTLLATSVLNWLLCSQRQLSQAELLAAVSLDWEEVITAERLLRVCCNLVDLDKALDILRFPHFSVREYLETRDEHCPANSHACAAESCLRSLLRAVGRDGAEAQPSQSRDPLESYATLHWATHCQMSGEHRLLPGLKEPFSRLLGQSSPAAFNRWLRSAAEHARSMAWDDPLKTKFELALGGPADSFFTSCVWGFEEMVRNHVAFGVEVAQTRSVRGYTGLHVASLYGHSGIVRYLLEIGADVDARSDDETTALHIAAEQGDEGMIRDLLAKQACVTARGESGQSVLHYACRGGQDSVIQLLIDEKAPIDAQDDFGRTALHRASESGNAQAVKLLLANGLKAELKDNDDKVLCTRRVRTAIMRSS
jgi:ankyrin repeat protein